jgi:hypothetical protein
MDFATQGEWGWTDRTVQVEQSSSPAKPGRRLRVCPTWATGAVCVCTSAGGPDQVFRLRDNRRRRWMH